MEKLKTMLELITTEMEAAFEKAGYDKELAKVTLSNRPDCANISATARWQEQRNIKKPRL